MAITHAGTGAKATSTTTTLTLSAPASPTNDDVWIAVISDASDSTVTTLTDWTKIFNLSASSLEVSAWYFRYAGSTPNLDATVSAADSIGGIVSFTGVKTSGSPVNTLGATGTGTDTSIEHTAITPSVDGCCLLVINYGNDDNTRTALGGDYTSAFNDSGTAHAYLFNSGDDLSIACSYDLSVGTSSTGTITQTMSAADPWTSVLIALEPADGAPAGQPYDLHEGGVPFVGNGAWGLQGQTVWRDALRRTWRNLLIPRRPIPLLR